MLPEPATRPFSRAFIPETPEVQEEEAGRKVKEDPRLNQVRELVAEVFAILVERQPHVSSSEPFKITLPDSNLEEKTEVDENVAPLVLNPHSQLLMLFEGMLKLDSEAAYDKLDAGLAPLDLVALFRQPAPDKQLIYIVQGRVNPRPRSWIPNLILFVFTLFSVLLVGLDMAMSEIASVNRFEAEMIAQRGLIELWRGFPYALSILLILGAHELGHYFAARRHKIAVTLPYFLPFPSGLFGTFGAFIQLRQPIRNRKMLLEIGAAGPLAGLVFAIPILLIGLATSQVGPPSVGGIVEGNSILYALAKIITFGKFLPDGARDVYVNQLAWAGWTGLFVTGLNLLPIGQLDGGHVLYSLLGNRARVLYFPLMAILLFLVIFSGGALLLLLLLLFLLGRAYAVPLDDITPLDRNRKWLAIGTLVVFALVFVPIPITVYTGTPSILPAPASGSAFLPIIAGLVVATWQRWRG